MYQMLENHHIKNDHIVVKNKQESLDNSYT